MNSVIGACIEAVYLTLCIRLARKAGSENVELPIIVKEKTQAKPGSNISDALGFAALVLANDERVVLLGCLHFVNSISS